MNSCKKLDSVHVLLIEDEPSDAHLVMLGLKGVDCYSHFEITWVTSIAQAQHEFEQNKIDVVLLDLTLPDSSGLNTLEKTKTFCKSTPIIVLTGHNDMDFAMLILEAGAMDYMVKGDFGFNGLTRVIHYALMRMNIELRNRLLIKALEAAGNGIVITDKNAVIEWANPAFTRLTGYSMEEAVGRKPRELLGTHYQDKHFYNRMWTTLLSGKSWRGNLINRRKNGSLYHEELCISPVTNQAGEITHYVGIKEDITERKALEEKLNYLANTDPLTGLFNRRTFMQHFHNEMERVIRTKRYSTALLMLDLDYFKSINDNYGHATGDEVLQQFSAVLRKNLRAIDIPARFGGEEFVILLPDSNQSEALIIAERLRQQVQEMPIIHGKNTVSVTVSIGVTILSAQDENNEKALHRADCALYQAKSSGRNTVFWCHVEN